MDKDTLKSLAFTERENFMRDSLGTEKCKVLDKYDLISNDNLYFEKIQAKYPTQEFFSYKFATKSSVLGMVFQIYRLCFAKTKYFENNWDKFIPCIYNYKKGFIETPIWNMECIKHKSSGVVLDLRELSKIHVLKEFQNLCAFLEHEETKNILKNQSQAKVKVI